MMIMTSDRLGVAAIYLCHIIDVPCAGAAAAPVEHIARQAVSMILMLNRRDIRVCSRRYRQHFKFPLKL